MQCYQENIERTTTNLIEFAEKRQIMQIDSIDHQTEDDETRRGGGGYNGSKIRTQSLESMLCFCSSLSPLLSRA